MKYGAVALMLMLFLGMYSADRVESASANLPDIRGADKMIWSCDGGATDVVLYRSVDGKWYVVVTLTKNFLLAMYSKSDHTVHWFVGSPREKQLREVNTNEWMETMKRASPNHYQQLRRKPNDCVKL